MDRVGQIAARAAPSAESGEARQLSVQQESERWRESARQTALLLMQMAAAFPHQETAEETGDMYQLAYSDMAMEYGLEPLRDVLLAFLRKQKFFPHPSEVEKELKAVKAKKQAEARANLPKVGCAECADHGNQGLIMVMHLNGERAMKACVCLQRYREAKRAAGVS
jgi:hypothetical protein